MARRGERDPKRERFWRRTMQQWARSGQSIRGYCAKHGLTETSFHAWRRELRKRDSEGKGSRRAARTDAPRARRPAPARFLPVRVAAATNSASIEIERNGTTIRLHGEVDLKTLACVLEAVGQSPC